MDIAAIGPEFAFVIRHGAGMLDDVDDVIRRCRMDRHPSTELARSCGTLVLGYLTLRKRLAAVPPSALTGRVDDLLKYAHEMTGQASMLAFRPHDDHWDRLAMALGDRLGAPADELRRLADAVAGRATVGGDQGQLHN